MFLCAGLCIFFVAVFFENIENEKGFHSTYQQHLSSKREDELGEKPLSDGLVTHRLLSSIPMVKRFLAGELLKMV